MQPSGLEVDKRQDESSNAARQIADGPELFLPSQAQEAEKVSPKSANAVHHDEIFGLRKATFLLSLALAIVTALGIVGVAVAGSVAAKRGRLVCGYVKSSASASDDMAMLNILVAGRMRQLPPPMQQVLHPPVPEIPHLLLQDSPLHPRIQTLLPPIIATIYRASTNPRTAKPTIPYLAVSTSPWVT